MLTAQVSADQALAAAAKTVLTTEQRAIDTAQQDLDQALEDADQKFVEDEQKTLDGLAEAQQKFANTVATAVQVDNSANAAALQNYTDQVLPDQQKTFEEESLHGLEEAQTEDALGTTLIDRVARANQKEADALTTDRVKGLGPLFGDDAQIAIAIVKKQTDDTIQSAQDNFDAASNMSTAKPTQTDIVNNDKTASDWSQLSQIANTTIMVIPPTQWEQMWNSMSANLSAGLDHATNFTSGFADVITLGATQKYRQALGMDYVDTNSWAYFGGQITGTATSFVIGGGAGAACNAGRAVLIVKGYSALQTGVGIGQAVNNYLTTGKIGLTDALTFAPAVGWAAGKIGVAAKLLNGCFVVDTPVAVGWSSGTLYVGQVFQPANPEGTTEDGESLSLGWLLAGVGIAATTVYLRKDDEEKKQRNRRRRTLYFADGHFNEGFADDPADVGDEIENCQLKNANFKLDRFVVAGTPLAVSETAGHNQNLEPVTMPSIQSGLQAAHSARSTSRTTANRCGAPPAARPLRKIRNPKSKLGNLLWALPFLLAGFCFWEALPTGERPATSTAIAAIAAPVAGTEAVPIQRKLLTRPIQEIQVGQRVLADNPELDGLEIPDAEIDPATWRTVRLSMDKPDGSRIDIVLLRSLDWLEEMEAAAGGQIELDLAELGADGPAEVVAIETCPPLETGEGRIVTGTFAHSAKQIIDVQVTGLDAPIGCTPNHPFWSEDRQAFVPAGEMRLGEALLQADGRVATVELLTQRTSREPVFNLEVDVEHTYYVSASGFLVHNSCALTAYADDFGHHIFSKKAFEGLSKYNMDEALAIGQQELARLNLQHLGANSITTSQQRLFREFAASGRANTLAEHARIAKEALIENGLSASDAADVVARALAQLKSWGITAPTRIPWGG